MGGRQDKSSGASRALQVALRSVHIASMALFVGGVAAGASTDALRSSLLVTVASGLGLLLAAALSRCLVLSEGAGWALFAKFALLALAGAVPRARLELYVAAMLLTSVASHMPARWRHKQLPWRRPRGEVPPSRGAGGD